MKVLFTVSVLLCFTGAACSDAADPITNTITCASVCERYQDCFDDDYDVSDCINSCEEDATDDEDQEERLEDCDACIDDRSCAESAFNCADECAGIVP